jgi:hypothetical protein
MRVHKSVLQPFRHLDDGTPLASNPMLELVRAVCSAVCTQQVIESVVPCAARDLGYMHDEDPDCLINLEGGPTRMYINEVGDAEPALRAAAEKLGLAAVWDEDQEAKNTRDRRRICRRLRHLRRKVELVCGFSGGLMNMRYE